MREILQQFINKTLRVYTISGVESYLGILQEVGDQHIILRSYFKDDVTYVTISHIESFKVETMPQGTTP